MLGLGAAPQVGLSPGAGTEVYHLSDPLVDRALALTRDVELPGSPEAAAYRATYATEAARAAPVTRICDIASMDTYWHGSMIAGGMSSGQRPSPMAPPTTAPPRWRTTPRSPRSVVARTRDC